MEGATSLLWYLLSAWSRSVPLRNFAGVLFAMARVLIKVCSKLEASLLILNSMEKKAQVVLCLHAELGALRNPFPEVKSKSCVRFLRKPDISPHGRVRLRAHLIGRASLHEGIRVSFTGRTFATGHPDPALLLVPSPHVNKKSCVSNCKQL